MEKLNSKIYDKYKNLKKNRLREDDEWSRSRGSDIKEYQTATEELIDDLKSKNEKLREQIASLQEKYSDCRKLLLEETQKTKELSNEVGRLQSMLLQKDDNCNATSPRSPYTSPRVRSRGTYKTSSKQKTPSACAIESEVRHKEATTIPYKDHQEDQILPECCQSNTTGSGDASGGRQRVCTFQTLMEFLVSMKFSLTSKPDGLCVSAIHQRNGYTFTLTWIGDKDAGDGELMYKVSSLGTLERVALDWMKEELVFRMTMCPVFFERISRVVGRC